MTDPDPGSDRRLDSWKAIADYLGRDVGTVRRWEKQLGLPVRRVPGGRGRSVFAYASEIDQWLNSNTAASVAPPDETPHSRRSWPVAAAGVTLLLAGAWWFAPRLVTPTPALLRVELSASGVTAFDQSDGEAWRYDFPASHAVVMAGSPRIVTADPPAVFVASSYKQRRTDDVLEGGELLRFDLTGRLADSFSFDDELRVHGRTFGAPWTITSFAVDDSSPRRRIAIAAHHYLWDPSLVTVLDAQLDRQGTFAHAGWIEAVHWLAADRLLIGGFSNPQDGGLVALLDPDALEGAGTRGECEGCTSGGPVIMIAMPRSEVNRASASRFNRAVIQVTPDRIVARTIEVPSNDAPADAVFEFTPSLELIGAAFSDRYWEMHRRLEAEGKLTHTPEQCPDRDGPREIRVWTPNAGWQTRPVVPGSRTP